MDEGRRKEKDQEEEEEQMEGRERRSNNSDSKWYRYPKCEFRDLLIEIQAFMHSHSISFMTTNSFAYDRIVSWRRISAIKAT